MTTHTTAAALADAIAACRDIPRDELLREFTEVVAAEHDRLEFAKAFSHVHKLLHAWMEA